MTWAWQSQALAGTGNAGGRTKGSGPWQKGMSLSDFKDMTRVFGSLQASRLVAHPSPADKHRRRHNSLGMTAGPKGAGLAVRRLCGTVGRLKIGSVGGSGFGMPD